MKKQIIILLTLSMVSVTMFAQISKGDVQIMQDYFGAEKTILVKEYMALSSDQDSLFWPIYHNYEQARLELGKERMANINEYVNNVVNITEDKAKELVNNGADLDIQFKKLQKKYFKSFSKKIGAVKAAQFYQFENYLNNVINTSIQESFPFVGDLEQRHSGIPKK